MRYRYIGAPMYQFKKDKHESYSPLNTRANKLYPECDKRRSLPLQTENKKKQNDFTQKH